VRLKDKRALVTGAASGIGRQIARLFAAEGATVIAADINEKDLAETAQGLDQIRPLAMDVSRSEAVRSAFETVAAQPPGLDILVCAAGVVGSKYGDGPVADCREEAWDHVMQVNLKGVWLCCKYALPLMLARGKGSIVTISSVTAINPPCDFFRSHAYMTSKGGVITLTKCIAAYYGRQGIRANAVAPGMIDTPMSKRMQGMPEVMAYLKDRQPLGALGDPTDIASAALYFAGDEACFVNGSVLAVDGGWSNHG